MARSPSPSRPISTTPTPTSAFRLRIPNPIHRFFLRLWILTHRSPDSSDLTGSRLPLTGGTGMSGLARSSSKVRRKSGVLPYRRFTLTSPTSNLPFRLRKRAILLVVIPSISFVFWSWYQLYYNWAINLSLSLRDKNWAPEPPVVVHLPDPPGLSGCFDPERLHLEMPSYNMTRERARPGARHRIESGVKLDQGMSCYDFAGSIRAGPEDYPDPLPSSLGEFDAFETDPEIVVYHTYWRTDLREFGPRQESTIRSFLATQHLPLSRLIIWTNVDPTRLPTQSYALTQLLLTHSTYLQVRELDIPALTTGTALEGHEYISSQALFDESAWVDGDVVRLLLLWAYGGIWFDMDEILVRDLRLLAGHEFVSQWDCRDDPRLILNGAIMSFRKQSPYLCEAFHLMSTSPPPSPNSLDWGSFLYARLLRSLLVSSIPPFSVVPWCFVDPVNCEEMISLPDPFQPDPEEWRGKPWMSDGPILGEKGAFQLDGRRDVEKRLGQVFSIHLHNRWEAEFPIDGWATRLLKEQEERVKRLEMEARV